MLDFSARAADRIKIAEEREKLQEAIPELGQRHNHLAPISVLHEEILCRIFLMASEEVDLSSREKPWTRAVSLSQVCSTWRKLALSLSHMWCEIDCARAGPVWISILLGRSRNTPIHVTANMDFDHVRYLTSLRSTLSHLSQMAELRVGIRYLPKATYESLISRLLKPAPSLKAFQLNSFVGFHLGSSILLPNSLFSGQAPLLRELSLSHCFTTFNSPIYNSLTSLIVESVSRDLALSPSAWLTVLRAMPLLKRLIIRDAINATSHFPDLDMITFLPLDYLELQGVSRQCGHLLANIALPSSCSVQIKCSEVTMGPDLQLLLESTFPNLKQEPSQMLVDFSFNRISLIQSEPESLECGILSKRNRPHRLTTYPNPPVCAGGVSITLSWHDDENLECQFDSIASTLEPYVYNVEQMVLTGSTIVNGFLHIMSSLLRPFSGVRCLWSEHGSAAFKLLSLTVKLGGSSQADMPSSLGSRVLLPALYQIQIRDVELTNSNSSDSGTRDSWTDSQIVPYRDLISSLQSRSEMGVPVKDIVFSSCRGVGEKIERLQEMGLHVIWDGADELLCFADSDPSPVYTFAEEVATFVTRD